MTDNSEYWRSEAHRISKVGLRLRDELDAARQKIAMGEKHGEALQKIAHALGLPPGADLHTECLAAVTAEREKVARLERLTKGLEGAFHDLASGWNIAANNFPPDPVGNAFRTTYLYCAERLIERTSAALASSAQKSTTPEKTK